MWKLVTKQFNRFMKGERIKDGRMLKVVNKIESGLGGTDLGGGAFSIRIARPNEGVRGGYRSAYTRRSADRIIFMAGFARSHQNRFDNRELNALQELARLFLSFNEDQIQKAIRVKTLRMIED